MITHSFILDLIVTAICAAFFVTLWNVIAHIRAHRSKAKPTEGNPFRRFKDHELQAILKQQL